MKYSVDEFSFFVIVETENNVLKYASTIPWYEPFYYFNSFDFWFSHFHSCAFIAVRNYFAVRLSFEIFRILEFRENDCTRASTKNCGEYSIYVRRWTREERMKNTTEKVILSSQIVFSSFQFLKMPKLNGINQIFTISLFRFQLRCCEPVIIIFDNIKAVPIIIINIIAVIQLNLELKK